MWSFYSHFQIKTGVGWVCLIGDSMRITTMKRRPSGATCRERLINEFCYCYEILYDSTRTTNAIENGFVLFQRWAQIKLDSSLWWPKLTNIKYTDNPITDHIKGYQMNEHIESMPTNKRAIPIINYVSRICIKLKAADFFFFLLPNSFLDVECVIVVTACVYVCACALYSMGNVIA